ncbi:hypothetical protein N7520_003761 [Penicillium odoratum]|uniref:uncharacterized protein n=1 Tax=Penicillium odoratum TaxID=1167516 RepID=UPI002547F384|nr:uncharacterized protein N7520_003761 [Penicillium odoratum]KAJ5769202.1 hypothetical protein N7520_003761 [Penicillium odoratum]
MEGEFRVSELYKKKDHKKPSSDVQSSIIADQNSYREKSIWRRISERDIHLSSVNEQTAEMLKTKDHALTQLREAQRLRQLKGPLLDPSEMLWMDNTILDVENAALGVAILLEPTRVEKETGNGKLSLGRQFRWVYRDSQRARDMINRLLACHSSLMAVLARLQRLDTPESATVPVHELEAEMAYKPEINNSPSLSPNLDDSVSCLSQLEENSRWNSPRPSTLDHEMNDMLAWRRSKGKTV